MEEKRRHAVRRSAELPDRETPRSIFPRRQDIRRESDRFLEGYTDVGDKTLRKAMAKGALEAMLQVEVQGNVRIPGADRRGDFPTEATLGIPPQLL